MTPRAVRRFASISPKWLMALLAPALIVGIVLMHSLLLEPASSIEHGANADGAIVSSMVAPGHASKAVMPMDMAMSNLDGQEDPAGHGTEGGMSDCSGLMAMCLALLVSFMVFVGWPRAASRWVLWQRPLPTFIRTGVVREAFLVMTARQRTTVIRC